MDCIWESWNKDKKYSEFVLLISIYIGLASLSHNVTEQGEPKQHLSLVVYGLCVQSEFCHFLKKVFSQPLEIGSVTD